MGEMKIPAIIDLLGEENAQKIKDAITDAIIGEIEERFENSWIVDVEELNDYFTGLADEVKEEVAKEFEEKLKTAMKTKLTGIEKMLEELT